MPAGRVALCSLAPQRWLEEERSFTDCTFDDLGVPGNPENSFYGETAFSPLGEARIDLGLGRYLEHHSDWADLAEENLGKQEVILGRSPYALASPPLSA